MTTEEEWRPIPSFPGYTASSHGRITGSRGNVLSLFKSKRGYLLFSVNREGRQWMRLVAGSVAEAFHGPKPHGFHTAHLDGNPLNNKPENLAYVSPVQNEAHKKLHGTYQWGERNPQSKLDWGSVYKIRADGRSLTAMSATYGVSRSNLSMIRSGRTWNPGGLNSAALEREARAMLGEAA